MLTPTQKGILLSELKAKSHPGKKIVYGNLEITKNYLRQTHNNAKNRAKKALEDMIFLAENYPEYIQDEDLEKLVSTKLAHGRIDHYDRKRKPQSMRSKRYARWVQVAGTLHTESGAPLIKPEINKKVWLAFNLLESVHESLAEISLLYSNMKVFRLIRKNGKIDLAFSRLATEKLGAAPLNVNALYISDNNEKCVALEVESADPAKLKILILENEDKK